MKKIILVLCILTLLIPLYSLDPTTAGWYECYVTAVGPNESGGIMIQLSTTSNNTVSFTKRWFGATTAAKKEMLAVALTAFTTGRKVDAYLTSADAYSTIERLYVINR